MNTTPKIFRISLLAAAIIASGCASTPRVNSEVQMLQSQLRDMRADERIAPYAAAELREAELAVAVLADQPRMRPEEFDQNLYLAGRLVSIAEAEGLARFATQRGKDLDRERETMLVESRTREADSARSMAQRERMRADDARQDARYARSDADQARLQSEQDRTTAEMGRRDTQLARDDASRARADAAAARQQLQQMQTELADLNAKQTDRGLVVTVGDVLFETDRAELRPGARRELDRLVDALSSRPGLDLAIEGHTDSTGTAAHNRDLSERRAASVRDYLTGRGVSRDRTTSVGLGQDLPVASNDTAGGRQQNRRVEIVIQQAQPVRVSRLDG
jgi:outer membrane protein OmpA-like peptidoglycan-associated protein